MLIQGIFLHGREQNQIMITGHIELGHLETLGDKPKEDVIYKAGQCQGKGMATQTLGS